MARLEFRRVLFRSGALGGFVAGSKEMVDYLRLYAHPYVYSCGLPPVVVAAILDRESVVDGKTGVQTCALPIWRSRRLRGGLQGNARLPAALCASVCLFLRAPAGSRGGDPRSGERRGWQDWSSDVCSSDLALSAASWRAPRKCSITCGSMRIRMSIPARSRR